jgi:predicted ATPase
MTVTDERSMLRGFGFAGYRSVSGEILRFGPLSNFNVLAAQNNSGKSNVLRFVHEVLPKVRVNDSGSVSVPTIAGFDLPQGLSNQTLSFSVAILPGAIPQNGGWVNRVMEFDCFRQSDDDLIWVDFEGVSAGDTTLDISRGLIDAAISEYGEQRWQQDFKQALHYELNGGTVDPISVMRRLIGRAAAKFAVPSVATISATRRIELDDTEESGDVLGGAGIISALAALQNPPAETWGASRDRFESINRFAQTVMDDKSVRVHVPHTRNTILIENQYGTFPLDNVGTGIHELIMFATASVIRENQIICIEEPETHLHPILQRKLAGFLTRETSNQYLVATHSAHLLNYEESTIFHLRMDGGVTSLLGVKHPHEFSALCADLGYRPSDLLQTNAVIWVEGPADRTYLRRWIELVAPTLKIDIDYSIMIYGGSTLNHLSADKSALDDFIDLCRLNRQSTVLIDSDKKTSRGRLNSTKQRIRAEFDSDSSQGFAWVTAGYTIENYIPLAKLQAAIDAVHRARTITGTDPRWSNPLATVSGKSFDKVAIARAAALSLDDADLNVFDLRSQVIRVVEFIRKANGA